MHSCRTLDLRSRGETKRQRESFDRVRRTERTYTIQLRKIAKIVGDIVNGFDWGNPAEADRLVTDALTEFAKTISPWAKSVAASMLVDVQRRDVKAWREITNGMGEALRAEILRAPTGLVFQQKMAEQVKLITSLPTEAAQRVHHLVTESMIDSGRAKAIADEIFRSGEVSRGRANLIARTEVGRAASAFTESRAQYIESPGYIWRTARDSEVRNTDNNPIGSHRLLEGKFIPWDKPPVASTNGQRAHAGAIYNCRCYPEPIIPSRFFGHNGGPPLN